MICWRSAAVSISIIDSCSRYSDCDGHYAQKLHGCFVVFMQLPMIMLIVSFGGDSCGYMSLSCIFC